MLESETQWMPHIDRLAKAKPADADWKWVLLGEALASHSQALNVASVLAHVGRHSVGGRLRLGNGRVPGYADEVVANFVAVEVNLDIRVGFHVPDLDARLCVDQKRLAIPQEPNRYGLRMTIAAGGHQPDHELSFQPALDMSVRRNHVDKYPSDSSVISRRPPARFALGPTDRRPAAGVRPG